MTLRYLYRPGSQPTTATGFATVQLTPDYGQFWAPRLVRVGMNLLTANLNNPDSDPIMNCTLYHGLQGDINIDAFVDSTMLGAGGDITAIMNGVLIQPGEYVTARWTRQDQSQIPNISGAIAYMELIGLTSDTLNDVAELTAASVPGARFYGQPPNKTFPPPAANLGTAFNFNNPGQNSTVQIVTNVFPGSVYFYELSFEATSTAPQCLGTFSTNDYYGPQYLASDLAIPQSPRIFEFNGLRSSGGGLVYKQLGPTGINVFTYSGAVTYRLPFPAFS